MEYTVQGLAKLAGVSPRTLRYYDQIGLLHPERISSSGYRIYGPAQVNRLQHILFYREMDMPLEDIARTLDKPGFLPLEALESHLAALQRQLARTAQLIQTVEKTIQHEKEKIQMMDKDKFTGFKEALIQENEAAYGAEIRKKYGSKTIEKSNAKLMSLSQEDYQSMEQTNEALQQKLEAAVSQGLSPAGEAGQEIATLHKKWLQYTWSHYSPEAHRGLGDMYLADERFTAYYDKRVPGCSAFLRDALHAWIS